MSNDNLPSQTDRAYREKFRDFDRRLKELERRLSEGAGSEAASVTSGVSDHFTAGGSAIGLTPGEARTSSTFSYTPPFDTDFLLVLFTSDMGVQTPIDGTWQGHTLLEWLNPVGSVWQGVVGAQPRLAINADHGIRTIIEDHGVIPTGPPLPAAPQPAGVPLTMRVQFDNEDPYTLGASADMQFRMVGFVFPAN